MDNKLLPDAELLAVRALEWLSTSPDMMVRFLAATGLAPEDVAGMADGPEGLAAVLDFILSEDDLVLGLAEALKIPPEHVVAARTQLPGGDLPHWT